MEAAAARPRPPLPGLGLLLLALALLLLRLPVSSSEDEGGDASVLLVQIKPTLSAGDGSILSSWSNTTAICSWVGIDWIFASNGSLLDCSSSSAAASLTPNSSSSASVYALRLPSKGLQGSIPAAISSFAKLQILDLSHNNLTGGIPLSMGSSPSLSSLNLSSNLLSGAIPSSLWNLCSSAGGLQQLQLDHNSFSSSIPDFPPSSSATTCSLLRTLDLSFNLLSGAIPAFVGSFGNLTDLDLSNNSLTGEIPQSLAGLQSLEKLDLANNNLSGEIPGGIKGGEEGGLEGNPLLCGVALGVECESGSKRLNKKVVAALVIGVMSISVVLLAVCVAVGHRHNWGRDLVARRRKAAAAAEWEGGGGGEDDVGDGKLIRFEGGEHLNVEDVLRAPGEVLGKSSYGTVYKAKLTGGAVVALRLLREDAVREALEFAPAAQSLATIRYPNVVPLLAYYAGPKGEKLLVYDYLSRGSLADLLYPSSTTTGPHRSQQQQRPPLGWARRHKILLGAARGLAHLHHGLRNLQLVHGNLKTRNIIVDESFEGHLADYGLPLLMNTAAQNEMLKAAAAQGYKAPELLKMSRANPKTDVYNLGIVMLEVLTGKKPREGNGEEVADGKQHQELAMYVKQAVAEERVAEIFDLEIVSGMRMNNNGGVGLDDGLLQVLQLAMGCCAPSPSLRPDIQQVVQQLEDIRPNLPTPLYTPAPRSPHRSFPPP